MRALWNGETLAQSDQTVLLEGNHYFPRESVNEALFEPSDTRTRCPWKGNASYLTVVVNGERNVDAAWYYPKARPQAKQIEGYVAFWHGVEVTD